jgi:hypothetical protein
LVATRFPGKIVQPPGTFYDVHIGKGVNATGLTSVNPTFLGSQYLQFCLQFGNFPGVLARPSEVRHEDRLELITLITFALHLQGQRFAIVSQLHVSVEQLPQRGGNQYCQQNA